jgi:hypothetical protein
METFEAAACRVVCVHGGIVLWRTGVPRPCLPTDWKRTALAYRGRARGVPAVRCLRRTPLRKGKF